MRNVSIWELNEVISQDIPPFVRLFQYKGVKRTLNEFLSPSYIYRDEGFFRRDRNIPNLGMKFDIAVKGQVVLMGYGSIEQVEKGSGAPLQIFSSFEQAVHWLIRNGYEFFGEESATRRCRKIVSIDLSDVNLMYQGIAREYEKNLRKPANAVTEVHNNRVCDIRTGVTIVPVCEDVGLTQTIKPPVPPTPPTSRVLNDQGAPVKHDSSIPVPQSKKPAEHKSFFRRLLDFLTK